MRTNFVNSKGRGLSILALALATASGCQEARNFNQMAGNTGNLAQTTAQLDGKMGVTETGVQALNDKTCDLYMDLRQGDSLKTRQETLGLLDKAAGMEDKVNDAGIYYMSFEFQLIKDDACDAQDVRESLYHSAFLEFFQDLSQFDPDPTASINPASTAQHDEDVLALSAALFMVNPTRAVLDAREGKPSVSMLSMIEEALARDKDLEAGKIQFSDLQLYEQDVLENQQAATQLLETRANFLPAMVAAEITTISKQGWLVQAWMTYMGTKASFDNLNIAQLNEYLGWMQEADREIDYLKAQGISLDFNPDVKTLYKNLALPVAGQSKPALALPQSERQARTAIEQSMLDEIHAFRKRIGAESAPGS